MHSRGRREYIYFQVRVPGLSVDATRLVRETIDVRGPNRGIDCRTASFIRCI